MSKDGVLDVEKIVNKVGNKFLLTTAVARRAIQIKEGDAPLIEDFNEDRPISTALQELQDEKILMDMESVEAMSRSESIFDEDLEVEAVVEEPEVPKKESKKKTKSLMA
jgi:DNA-directed RNA polymerase omega subunit